MYSTISAIQRDWQLTLVSSFGSEYSAIMARTLIDAAGIRHKYDPYPPLQTGGSIEFDGKEGNGQWDVDRMKWWTG